MSSSSSDPVDSSSESSAISSTDVERAVCLEVRFFRKKRLDLRVFKGLTSRRRALPGQGGGNSPLGALEVGVPNLLEGEMDFIRADKCRGVPIVSLALEAI